VNLRKSLLSLLTVASLSTAFAQVSPKAPLPNKFRFLNEKETNPAQILPPPAKDGSESQQHEMQEVKRLVQTRSKERLNQAHWDANHEDPTPFATAIGLKFDLAKLPVTAKLLEDVLNDQTVATSNAKERFKRKFPVAAAMPGDSYGQWTCDDVDRKPEARPLRSYPSGHSTMAYTFGIVLASLIPEKSQAILTRAADYAYSREICGDHYHSDVEAGHVLGTALGELILHNEGFRSELQAARKELKDAGITE
jgi:acid phosphatase (class A)